MEIVKEELNEITSPTTQRKPLVSPLPVDAIQIDNAPGLDRIHVFWLNFRPGGEGSITIICYGSAWTAYFGGMMGQTIQQFVADADADYLSGKFHAPDLRLSSKEWKRQDTYLARIIRAVQDAIREAPSV